MKFTTKNLKLRPFSVDDAAFIVELLNSPGWMKFIGDRGVKTLEDARNYLVNGPIKSYSVNHFGLSMVELHNGIAIGMCGLIKRDGLSDIDLGFAMLPAYTGNGYTTEIAKATIDYAFSQLKLRRLVAITDPANTASIRVLEKSGMTVRDRVVLPGDTKELLLFGVDNPS